MGNAWYEFKMKIPAMMQMFPPKPKFSVEEIPDLTGRVVIVTGQ